MAKHKHSWWMVGTSLNPPTIEVDCKCGAQGQVTEFSQVEWDEAFYSNSNPIKWHDEKRVKVIREVGAGNKES